MGKRQLFVLIVILAGSFIAAEDTPESDVPSEIPEGTPTSENADPDSLAAVPLIVDVSSGIPLNEASEKEEDLDEPLAAPGVTKFIVEKIAYTWTIKNYVFNNLGFDEGMYSPLFWGEKSKDHQWQLTLYPKGSNQVAKNDVGLYLCLTSKKDVMASVNLYIIDKNGKKTNSRYYKNKFEGKKGVIARWGYKHFISQKNLENTKKADYLPNGKLTLKVEISFSPRIKESSGFCDESNDDDECLAMPYENNFHNDVHLYVDHEYIAAQKAALAAHSTWFADKLRINPRTFLIDLPSDVKADEMEQAVKFIYTGTINPDKAENLLSLANKLGMKQLKVRCEEILCLSMAPTPSAINSTEIVNPAA